MVLICNLLFSENSDSDHDDRDGAGGAAAEVDLTCEEDPNFSGDDGGDGKDPDTGEADAVGGSNDEQSHQEDGGASLLFEKSQDVSLMDLFCEEDAPPKSSGEVLRETFESSCKM